MSEGSTALAAQTVPEGTQPDDFRLGRRVAISILCAAALVVSVLNAVLPASPVELLGPETKQTLRMLIPEGWAFFTKSPRSPSPVVYQNLDGRWHNVTAGPLAVPSDLMGLDRESRGQGTELAMLMAGIPKQAWRKCDDVPFTCLSSMDSAGTLRNGSHKTVCGDIGFVVQEVLPWAWRDAPTVMPSQTARVRVTC